MCNDCSDIQGPHSAAGWAYINREVAVTRFLAAQLQLYTPADSVHCNRQQNLQL